MNQVLRCETDERWSVDVLVLEVHSHILKAMLDQPASNVTGAPQGDRLRDGVLLQAKLCLLISVSK